MWRRTFLKRLRALPLSMLGAEAAGASPTGGRDVDYDTLTAVVDTIVPADDEPGAVEAGVAAQLHERLGGDPWHRTIYQRGLALMDRQARARGSTGFATLPLTERVALLESLLAGGNSDGKQFFLRARRDVFDLFYTSPIGQASLDYEPPANGYPDYAGPSDWEALRSEHLDLAAAGKQVEGVDPNAATVVEHDSAREAVVSGPVELDAAGDHVGAGRNVEVRRSGNRHGKALGR